ncbi:hypothetical protein VJJ74_07770, partial [Parvimonas micra]|uniref:hypothetical protein n=3 Tax=Parvimonas TaxID=543311 RepID=UPI002B464842
MSRLRKLAVLVSIPLLAGPAVAQNTPTMPNYKTSAGNTTSSSGWVQQDTDGVPLAAKRRETFALVASNTPAAASTLFGGLYVLNQSCTGYGTLIL